MATSALKELQDKWIGKSVRIIYNKTFGCGEVKIGDIAIVTDVVAGSKELDTKDVLILSVLPVKDWNGVTDWSCLVKDVEIIDGSKLADDKHTKFISDYLLFVKSRSKIYVNKVRETNLRMNTLEDELSRCITYVKDWNKLIRSNSSSAGHQDKNKISNILKLLDSKYTSIVFNSDCTKITAITKPIVMTFIDYNKVMHSIEMGVYYVNLDLVRGITFGVKSRVHEPVGDYLHPHITGEGVPCWGTWGSFINDKHMSGDYLGMLLVAHEYLSACDRDGWYITGLAFGKDASKLCQNCWQIECGCDRCEYCDELLDNCECKTCPNSGDRISEVGGDYCDGCSHLDEDGRCNY